MNNEIKDICRKCEHQIHCQGKGCAFRSLGNEYCDEVENANNLIKDLQKQLVEQVNYNLMLVSDDKGRDYYKNIIDKAIEYLKDREEDNECCSVCSVISDRLLEILRGK